MIAQTPGTTTYRIRLAAPFCIVALFCTFHNCHTQRMRAALVNSLPFATSALICMYDIHVLKPDNHTCTYDCASCDTTACPNKECLRVSHTPNGVISTPQRCLYLVGSATAVQGACTSPTSQQQTAVYGYHETQFIYVKHVHLHCQPINHNAIVQHCWHSRHRCPRPRPSRIRYR